MSWSYFNFRTFSKRFSRIGREKASGTTNSRIQLETLEDRVLFDASPLGELLKPTDLGSADAITNELIELGQDYSSLETFPANPESLDFDESALTSEFVDANLESIGHLVESLFETNDGSSNSQHTNDAASQLIVVDGSIEGLQELLADLERLRQSDAQILVLDSQKDGLEQISNWVSSFSRVSELHLFVHANNDEIQIGSTSVSLSNFSSHADQWLTWNHALADGADLMIYGCELAATESGQTLIGEMARWTGLDIAASSNLTGAQELGGDWSLEYRSGDVFSTSIFAESPAEELAWKGLLNLPGLEVSNNGNTKETSSLSGGSDRSVAMHSDGSFVLVWSEDVGGSSDWDVFAKRFAADGTALTSSFVVNQHTDKKQHYAAIGMDDSGNFVVTWTSKDQDGSGNGVWGRRFAADGTPLSTEFQVNTDTSGEQQNSSVAVRGDGSFVIAWEGAGSSDSYGIYGQRFDAAGNSIGGNFWVNSVSANSQFDASVSINSTGNFAVSWDDTGGYHFQRFDWSGSKIGSAVTASALTSAGNGSILLNDDNTIATTWRSTTLGLTQVWTRGYDSSNVVSFGPILVSSITLTDNHSEPSISGTGTGSYTIIWEGESGSDAGNILARRFNSDGSYASSVTVVNDQTSGTQTMASVASLSGSTYVVAWTDDGDGAQDQGVYVRIFSDPPQLNTGLNPTLNPVNEGDLNSPGTLISDLLPVGSVTQVSGPPNHGMAIVGLNASYGTWQFSLDGGSVWTNIDAKSINSQTNELALLLGPAARIRLVPFVDMNGTIANAITFRAWDLTSGTPGTYSVISNPGVGVSPFSLATDTAGLSIAAVNDAPVFETGVGYVTDGHGSSAFSNSIAQQVDGKTVVTGRFLNGSQWDIFVSRFNFDGTRDTTFGTNGTVEFGLGSADDWSNVVAVQSDGKIVVGGQTMMGGFVQQAVARLNADGSLDTSFGSGGVFINAITSSSHDVKDLRILNDGKILFVGATVDGYRKFTAVQLNSNGTLDTSFGTNGVVMTDLGSAAFGRTMEIQANGEILLGGYRVVTGVSRVAVVRYHANGTLDSTFGTGGISELNIASSELNAMQLLSDGRILIGATLGTGTTNDFAVMRLQSNGSLDSSFQSVGYRALDFGFDDELTDMVVQPDGKIVLVGSSDRFPINVVSAIRLNADGSDDLTYGTNGKIQHEVGSFSRANAALVQPDGKLMIAGSSNPNGPPENFVLRLEDNGSRSDRFGVSSNLGGTYPIPENGSPIVLDPNVQIVDGELIEAGRFGGAQLELYRNGGATSSDIFSATGTLGALTEGANLTVGGTVIGTVTTNSGGRLLLTFNNAATRQLVNETAQQIALRNDSATAGEFFEILYRFNDGNIGAQGSGGAADAWGSVQLNVISTNSAPVLDSLANPTFSTINEDAINNSGQTVAAMLASSGNPITDSDAGALEGIAITGMNQGNGSWQFSVDSGSTWSNVGLVSNTNALLLRDADRIRFVPNGENGTNADITFRAWDQTGATANEHGTFFDTSSNGGTRAFSSNTAVATIVVSSVNDAPMLDNSGTMTLTTIGENQITNSGDTISSIISSAGGNRITDVDTGASEGIAVTSLNSGNGSWEYSIDNGTTWASVGTISDVTALLLRAEDRIRFVPNGENGTNANFTFRAWDQSGATAGQHGTKTNVSINGGSTQFSTNFETASITVTSANDAPVLDSSGSFVFSSIHENQATNSGDLVSSLIASAGGNRITDVDASATEGIAITGLNAGNGRWQYSTNGGSTWTDVGTVSDASALLLRATDRIRFVPNSQNGTAGSIEFRAWDQTGATAGQQGTKVDAAVNGGTSAFSSQTATANIVVSNRNDAPVLDNTGTLTLTTIDENQTGNSGNTISAIISSGGGDRITDVDSGALEGVAITSLNSGNGSWEYSLNNGTSWFSVGSVSETGALLLRAEDRIRFVPNGIRGTLADFTFRAWDQTGASAGLQGAKTNVTTSGGTSAFSTSTETASIAVVSQNDAPILDLARAFTFSAIDENQNNNLGDSVSALIASAGGDAITDVDPTAVEGIAITGLNAGNGYWLYSINAGASWNNVGIVSETNALLLRESDRIRFVPDGQNGTAAFINFRGWDQTGSTAGQHGTKMDASVFGGATSFSSLSGNANILVTDINDAPVLDTSGTMTLTPLNENDINGSGNTISAIISSAGGDRINDVDTGALEGIAVTSLNSAFGNWEYSINDGRDWRSVGSVSESNALLLRAEDRIRFVPDGQSGTVADFSFRAWDQSGVSYGLQGTKANLVINGGRSPISVASETATITVSDQNDMPEISVQPTDFDFVLLEETNSSLTSAGTLTVTDSDVGDSVTASITSVSIQGDSHGLASGRSALLAMLTINNPVVLNAPDTVGILQWQFDSSSEAFDYLAVGQSLELSYEVQVTDTSGGQSSHTITIQIVGSNDAPEIVSTPGNSDRATLIETNSSLMASGSVAVSDLDLEQTVLGSTKSVSIVGDRAGCSLNEQQIISMLNVSPTVVGSGSSLGSLSWSFNSGAGSFDFLSIGENFQLVYTIEVTDSFSSIEQQVVIEIVGTNDTPHLKSGASVVMFGDAESGNRIGSLVGIEDSIVDLDHGSAWGVVITTSDITDGFWQYRLAGASDWQSLDTSATDLGTLLGVDDYIRFVSETDHPVVGTVGFRAWDHNYGVSGSSVLLSELEANSTVSTGAGQILTNVAGPPTKNDGNSDSSESDSKENSKNEIDSEAAEETAESEQDALIGGNQANSVQEQTSPGTVGIQGSNLLLTTQETVESETKLNLVLIEEAYDPSKSDNYYRLSVNPNEQGLEFSEAYVFGNAIPISFDDELIWTRFFEGLNQSSQELLNNQYQIGVPTFAASTASLLTVGYLAWMIRGGVLLTTFMSSMPTWRALDILSLIEHSGQDKETIEQIVDSKVAADAEKSR